MECVPLEGTFRHSCYMCLSCILQSRIIPGGTEPDCRNTRHTLAPYVYGTCHVGKPTTSGGPTVRLSIKPAESSVAMSHSGDPQGPGGTHVLSMWAVRAGSHPVSRPIREGGVLRQPFRTHATDTSNRSQIRYRSPSSKCQEDTVYTVGSLQR